MLRQHMTHPQMKLQSRRLDKVFTSHQSIPLVLPSVPVDQLLDDHAVEFEECKRWANSDAGQAARMTNPVGFANVRAHAEAHLRAMAPASVPNLASLTDQGRLARVNPPP